MNSRRRFTRKTKKQYVVVRSGTQGRNRPGFARQRIYRSSLTNPVHNFKRSLRVVTSASTGIGAGQGTYYGIFSPQLNQMPNVTEFQNLFDQYRINYVVYRIIWRSTNISSLETVNNQNMGAPYVLYTLDRDDSTVPTTTDSLREYAQCKEFIFTPDKRVCYIKFKPNTLQMIYQSAVNTSYSVQYKRWIDIADAGTTPYYGVKFAILSPNAGLPLSAQIFDIEATYYFQCRVPR